MRIIDFTRSGNALGVFVRTVEIAKVILTKDGADIRTVKRISRRDRDVLRAYVAREKLC